MSYRLAAGLAALVLATPALARAESPAIGGVGLQYCANVTGAENAPNLAEAVDWAMGYFAGRIDAGQMPGQPGPLTADPMDAAVAITQFCRANPASTVLEAVRDQSLQVFASHPAPQAPLAEDLAATSQFEMPVSMPRPKPRPIRIQRQAGLYFQGL